MSKDNLRDGRVKNWFYLENDLLDREDLTIYEKTVYIVIARYVNGENKAFPSYPCCLSFYPFIFTYNKFYSLASYPAISNYFSFLVAFAYLFLVSAVIAFLCLIANILYPLYLKM